MARKDQNNNSQLVNLLRSEITFWMAIIVVIVGVVVAFQQVDAKAEANERKTISNEAILKEIDGKVDTLIVQQAEIKKDINYIIDAHIIE